MSTTDRKVERLRRHRRLRRKISGTGSRPRLCITKSLHHVYAQVVDDEAGTTLISASTLDRELRETITGCNIHSSQRVGELLAKRALEHGIETVVFDRGGYRYHGVVAALAEACRKGGLRF